LRRLGAVLIVSAAAAAVPSVHADDAAWPQWLGPSRDGTVKAGALREPKALKLVPAWRLPLGPGVSGVVVSDGRAFTLFSDGTADYAVAVGVSDGREAWRVKLDPSIAASEQGPASTPLVAGKALVVLSGACQLRALDTASGKLLWHRDLAKDFKVAMRRGCSTSPLLEGGALLVQAGGRDNDQRLLALEPATGKTVWSAKGPERTLYSSPVVSDIGGVRQVVVHHTVLQPQPKSALLGLRVSDQSVLWTRPLENLSFDTPLVMPDGRVALATWSDMQVVRVSHAAGQFKADPLWSTKDLVSHVSPPVYADGHLYGFGGDFLACLDASTGRTVWKEKLYPGSVILVDGHLVVLSVSSGLLRVVEATPAGYREKAKLEVLTRGARAEAPPSFAAGHIFVRDDEQLVAVRIEG
jgi:outer membrane protein assembly factor BamB